MSKSELTAPLQELKAPTKYADTQQTVYAHLCPNHPVLRSYWADLEQTTVCNERLLLKRPDLCSSTTGRKGFFSEKGSNFWARTPNLYF